jgi:hypothetical protein
LVGKIEMLYYRNNFAKNPIYILNHSIPCHAGQICTLMLSLLKCVKKNVNKLEFN